MTSNQLTAERSSWLAPDVSRCPCDVILTTPSRPTDASRHTLCLSIMPLRYANAASIFWNTLRC